MSIYARNLQNEDFCFRFMNRVGVSKRQRLQCIGILALCGFMAMNMYGSFSDAQYSIEFAMFIHRSQSSSGS